MISLLTPTRKRPHRLAEMLKSVRDTSRSGDGEVRVYVSDCDDSYDDMIRLNRKSDLHFHRGPRVTFSNLWNMLLPFAKGDIYMLCADDVIFKTPGWDLVVNRAYAECPDKILCCYGNDGSPNGLNFATLPFVSRRWVEILGQFTPDGYSSDFCDSHVQDIADMIGRKKLLPIETLHAHWLWGKAEKDEVYEENLARNERDNNTQRYVERLPERIREAEKLREAMIHA